MGIGGNLVREAKGARATNRRGDVGEGEMGRAAERESVLERMGTERRRERKKRSARSGDGETASERVIERGI